MRIRIGSTAQYSACSSFISCVFLTWFVCWGRVRESVSVQRCSTNGCSSFPSLLLLLLLLFLLNPNQSLLIHHSTILYNYISIPRIKLIKERTSICRSINPWRICTASIRGSPDTVLSTTPPLLLLQI